MTTPETLALCPTTGTYGAVGWRLRYGLIALSCLVAASAQSTTNTEEKLRKSPMPHETLGTTDSMVKVHLTRLEGYIEGKPNNGARLAELKSLVQRCVQQGAPGGSPVRPPKVWPDFLNSQRTDEYTTANRSIKYTWALGYSLNPRDCSLLEVQTHEARLTSTLGHCDIDLVTKTARGFCDSKAHAGAPQRPRIATSSMAEVSAAQKRHPDNAALSVLAAAMKQYGSIGTSVYKTILGLKCAVSKNPLDLSGTVCLSLGGSFVAYHATGEQHDSNMVLEMTSYDGINLHAVEARLDTMVDSAVFAPHEAGSFSITKKVERK